MDKNIINYDAVASALGTETYDIRESIEGYPPIMKLIEESTTIEEIRKMYDNTPSESESRKAALDKWNTLCLEALESATTIEEIRKVYGKTPSGSESRKAAIIKTQEILNSQ